MIGSLIWFLFAAFTVFGAVVVATSKNILHCAFGLLASLTGVTAMYVFLGADFLAMAQVVVYVGGILVLILFGVMMTHRLQARSLRQEIVQPVAAVGAALLVFALSVIVISRQVWPVQEVGDPEPTTRLLGKAFLTSHLFPFEFASILLLVAMIGAAMITRAKRDDDGEDAGA